MLISLVTLGFAQTPKKVLSAGDIDAFIKNFNAMEADLEALGDKYDDYFGFQEADDPDYDFVANFNKIRTIKIPAEVEAIYRKHGLGNNGLEKTMVITIGVSVVLGEQMMAAYADMPEAALYMDTMKAQFDLMRSIIHPDDIALVSKRATEIAAVLGMEYE